MKFSMNTICDGLNPGYRTGVANVRLFEGLFVALDKCTRVPFSFLCYCILKNYYRSECVSKCLLNC